MRYGKIGNELKYKNVRTRSKQLTTTRQLQNDAECCKTSMGSIITSYTKRPMRSA